MSEKRAKGSGKNTQKPPERGGKPSTEKTPIILGIGAVILLAVIALSVWFMRQIPTAPANTPSMPENSDGNKLAGYPSLQAFASFNIDAFFLVRDGSVKLITEISESNDGFTVEYLQENLSLNPPAPFTIKQLSPKTFEMQIENGQKIPDTRISLKGRPDDERVYEWSIEPTYQARLQSETPNQIECTIDGPIVIEFSDTIQYDPAQGEITLQDDLGTIIDTKVEVQENLITFHLNELLEYDGSYNIFVPEALKVGAGSLSHTNTIWLHTELPDYTLVLTSEGRHIWRPKEEITLEYQLNTKKEEGREVFMSVYSFPDAQAYSAWLAGERKSAENANPIREKEKIAMKEGLNEYTIENPGKGFFLICATVIDTKTRQEVSQYIPIQIATPSLYLQAHDKEILAWLHDYQTGKPLANHTLEVSYQGATVFGGKTNAEGILSSKYHGGKRISEGEQQTRYSLVRIYNPQGELIYVDSTDSVLESIRNSGEQQNRYYSFFYNDRMLYRPTDTIEFWGFIKPYRYNTAPAPKTITVTLDPHGINQKVEVQVGADGSYSGKMPIEKLAMNQYELELSIADTSTESNPSGKKWLETRWVDIKEFTAPTYVISASVDQPIYRAGDEVTVKVTPTFYDGTPLPNYPLEFHIFNPYTGNFDATQKVSTDSAGVATVTFKAGETFQQKELPWAPQRAYYYVQIAHDGENITYRGDYVFLPGNVMIRPEIEFQEDGKATLAVKANRITTEKLTDKAQVDALVDGDMGYYSYKFDSKYWDLLAGDPVDMELTADLNFNYIETTDYTYKNEEQSLTLSVRRGFGKLENLYDFPYAIDRYARLSANISYRTEETAGTNTIQTSISESNYKPEWDEGSSKDLMAESIKGYTFNVYTQGSNEPIQSYESYLMRSSAEVDVGQQLRLELLKDGIPVPNGAGQLLYTVLQDHTIERSLIRSSQISFLPTQQHANSVLIVAAYYDGREVYPVNNVYLRINRDSMKLNVEIMPDKQTYLPGEQANIRAKVTDQKGNPVSASLCFGVVDEAIFALREQSVDPLRDLYSDFDFQNYYVFKYTTLRGDISPFNQSGDGGKGEGTEMAAFDSFRKNFKDTAAFYPTHSDVQGNASFSLKLPDNITSWRITTVAVGDNLYGGNNKTSIISTLPFFCKPVISPKYIAGDEIAMLVQGYGNALSMGDEISYTVKITGDQTDLTKQLKGKAYESAQVNFGVLPEGEYTVTATAQFAKMKDTVELPLAIIPSNLELVVNRNFDPSKPLQLDALRYPVTISLYDESYAPYYENISSLLTHYCLRIDQRMSRFAAKRALMKHSAYEDLPQHIRVDDSDVAGYQNQDGGIGWQIGGDSDPIVSMKISMFAKECFSIPRLKNYFLSVAENSSADPEEKAAAWAGLCVVDSSYAQQVKERISNSNLPFEEQLYLLAGLSYADPQTAKALYDTMVTPLIEKNHNQRWLSYAAPNDKQRAQKDERATALAWITASRLGLEDADGYALYFGKNHWRINSIFESMIYVYHYDKPVPEKLQVTYSMNGKEKMLDLSKSGSAMMTLTRSELESLKFTSVPPNLMGTAYYIGEPDEADIKPSDTLKVEKFIAPMEDGKYKVTLNVAFDAEASFGYYNISDWIPSNTRLHSILPQTDKNLFVDHTQENQKLYFEFSRSQYSPSKIKIEYIIQQTYQNKAMVDRTYVVCADSGESASSERYPFEIKK